MCLSFQISYAILYSEYIRAAFSSTVISGRKSLTYLYSQEPSGKRLWFLTVKISRQGKRAGDKLGGGVNTFFLDWRV